MARHKGQCHCGAVSFSFDAPPRFKVTLCNCSICHMTGFEHVFVPQDDVKIAGADKLTHYAFGTGQAKHMFCRICGVKPLYIPRSHPDCYSINLRCVEHGTFEVTERIDFDGQNWDLNIDALRAQD